MEAINKDCYRFDRINQSLASHALIERIFITIIKYSFILYQMSLIHEVFTDEHFQHIGFFLGHTNSKKKNGSLMLPKRKSC